MPEEDLTLPIFLPEYVNKVPYALTKAIEETLEVWKPFLLGYFVEKRLLYHLMKKSSSP